MEKIMSKLDTIIERGNRGYLGTATAPNKLRCADGFTLSVIAGWGAYCSPRPGWSHGTPDDYSGPYTAVEVGFPSAQPEPWDTWREHAESPAEATGTVYSQVPVDVVRALVAAHGGEVG